jgi:putative membrane protein
MKPFQGKSIEIGGFVYRQDEMTNTQFVVARLAMECCSADSTPYGFLVEWPEAVDLPEDSWVTVEGTIGTSHYGDMDIVMIQATSVEPMAMPETPYVYPNYDILDES